MTAGLGLLHREMAHHKQPVHTLELWLNLPAEIRWLNPVIRTFVATKCLSGESLV